MAGLRGLYDPNDKPNSGFEVLPAGQYTVKVTGGEMKHTKKGDGQYLQIEMTVVDGQHTGAIIFDRFNLVNPSQEAVRIAKGQFASLREAIGVREPNDIPDLMGPRFQLVLKCEKRNDEPGKMTNVVQRYIKRGQTATTPQQSSDAAPWARNAPKPDAPSPAQAESGNSDVPW